MAGEIEIVHVNKEAGTVRSELLFGILEEESGFSYATGPFDTDQTVAPIDFVHQITTNRSVGVLNKVSVCAVE